MTQCTWTTGRTHVRCMKEALPNLDVCASHRAFASGDSMVDQHRASPDREAANLRARRYSRTLPVRLAEVVEEQTLDPDLLSMQSEIQLLDARIADVIARAHDGESGALWHALRQTYKEMQSARRAKNSDEMAVKLSDLGQLIEKGFADYSVWDEIRTLITLRQRLAESEQKRLVQLKLVLTYDEAERYASRILSAVQRHVSDPEARARIAADIRQVAGEVRGLALPKEAARPLD